MNSQDQLQALFDFTADELNQNQNGVLSERQVKSASKKYKTLKIILLLVSLPLVLVGIVMLGLGISTQLLFGLAIGGGVMLLVCLPMLYFGLRPIRKIHIQTFSGPIKLARVQRSNRTNDTVHYYTASELHISGKAFTIPDPAFSLLNEGSTYIVYAENDADHIFSLEETS